MIIIYGLGALTVGVAAGLFMAAPERHSDELEEGDVESVLESLDLVVET